ncbi:sepiapterin reductase-like [Ptychodera flava]|uniref:sepiapterin reductase-like n=1 Tax=Ptychodera flava TaxID=63121 RepID=UPI00396A9640
MADASVSTMAVFGVPSFCLITGASKGIGRGIALQLAEKVGDNSLFVLTARSEAGLQETRGLVAARRGSGIEVRTVTGDMGNMDALSTTVSDLFDGVDPTKFKHAILVNNAGSLGDTSQAVRDLTDPSVLQDYFGLNVTSAICLTAQFIQRFPEVAGRRRTVVNITTLCGIQPFPYNSVYCTSKAARNMLFQVMALEEPDVRVLNYAPGPIDTDMQADLRANLGDPEMRKMYNDMKAQGKLLSVEATCKVLVKILEEDTYKSGSHVDYYDVCK